MLALVRGRPLSAVMLSCFAAAPFAVPHSVLAQVPDRRTPESSTRARPPRINGPYFGAILGPALVLARVNEDSGANGIPGFRGTLAFGQMLYPWFGLGFEVGGAYAAKSRSGERQQLGQGLLLVDARFVPLPKIPLSLRASFGFGGGAVGRLGRPGRDGFGGAIFGAGIRYEFFPRVGRYRPHRAGGFGIGPALGWSGFMPATAGGPMAHTFYVALATTFYFGH